MFDRLGPGMDVLETRDRHAKFRDSLIEDEEYRDLNQPLEKIQSACHQRDEFVRHVGNITALKSETGLVSDSLFENEGYDDANVVDRGVMDVF